MRWLIPIGIAGLLLWAGVDLLGSHRTDIRVFDPDEVARLDTAMWRSYYDKKPLPLFLQLAELMRRQFHLPLLRSYVVAARAARAAFVFKDGRNRAEHERALPDLIAYYRAIRRVSATPFDVENTARTELEWWIVHRQRARHGADDLEGALAVAAAELYRMPAATMMPYARERTVAMTIRDTKAANGGLAPADWAAIEQHLRLSWRSLAEAVRPTK